MRRPLLIFAALAMALACATLVSPQIPGRYETTKPKLIANADFSDRWRGWSGAHARRHQIELEAGDPHALRLIATGVDNPVWLSAWLRLDEAPFDHVRVSAELRTQSMRGGGEPWQSGQVRLLGVDRRGRIIEHWPATIARVDGTTAWHARTAILPVSPEAKVLWLMVYVAADEGALMIRNIEVDGVVERPAWVAGDALLAAGWIMVWCGAGIALARRARGSPLQRLALLASVVIVIAGTTPQPYYQNSLRTGLQAAASAWTVSSGAVAQLGERWRSGPAEQAQTPAAEKPAKAPSARAGGGDAQLAGARAEIARARDGRAGPAQTPGQEVGPPPPGEVHDGTGHLAAFSVLALLAGLGYRRTPAGWRLVALVAFSASIQVAQVLSVGREPDLADMAADLLGILAGSTVAWALLAALHASRAPPRGA